MAQVESVDWPGKLVYLHADTVVNGFDAIAAHFEINALTAVNGNGEQNFFQVMSAEGKIQKTATTFTASFVLIETGWRFVPHYALGSHNLDILVEMVSKENLTDRDVFDRSGAPVGVNVNIDPVYDVVQIVVVGSTVANVTSLSGEAPKDFFKNLRLKELTGAPGTFRPPDDP